MKVRLFEEYSDGGARKISDLEFNQWFTGFRMDLFTEYEIGIISNLFDGARYGYYFLREGGWDVGKKDINYIRIERSDKDIFIYKFEDEWFIVSFLESDKLYMDRFLCDQFYSLVDTIEINKNI